MLSFNCFLPEKWDDSTIFVSLSIFPCMCVFECIDFAFSWVASEMQIPSRFGFLLEKRIHKLSSSSFVRIWIWSFIASLFCGSVFFWTDFKEISTQNLIPSISLTKTRDWIRKRYANVPQMRFDVLYICYKISLSVFWRGI